MVSGRRVAARLAIAVALALGTLIAAAVPAFAHAQLEDTTPRNGAHLDAAPSSVTLHFSESVQSPSGGIRVYDANAKRLDNGRVSHPNGDGSRVAIALPKLPDGGYVVTWRVISADSHPVQGAFTFTVGTAKAAADTEVAGLLASRGGSKTVGAIYSVGRSVAFAAMLLLLGGGAFLLLVWPDGSQVAAVRRALWIALATLAGVTVVNFLLQGAYAGGLGLADAFKPSVISGELGSRFGHVYLVRLALLAAAVPLVATLFRRPSPPSWWQWAGLAVGGGIAATPGFAGHGSIGSFEPYALIADIAHVAAASVWIGGLFMLVVFVLRRRDDDLRTIVRRFSEVAFWSVTVLVATGVFQGYRQVGTLDALTSTSYGKLLIVKSAIVAAMLGFAWLSRRATHARWSPDTISRVRRTVAAEAALAVAVLGVTGILVNAVPAKVLAAAPQSGELTSPALLVDYTVSPGRSGLNEIHLYTLTKIGQPQAVAEMTLKLSLPGKGIAPITVPLEVAGPGHYQSLSFALPIKGTYRMDVIARTSDIDETTFEGSVTIR